MKTLDEYNAEQRAKFTQQEGPVLNGIACPECGAELMDTHPNITLLSNPPQKNVKCSKCDYSGYRVCGGGMFQL